MARRFNRNAKRRKRINRAMNNIARRSRKLKSKVQSAKSHVFNLTSNKLTDGEY